MAETSQNEDLLDLGGLSDEEIASMSPSQIDKYLKMAVKEEAGDEQPADDVSDADEDQPDTQSAAAGEEEDTGSDVTGGADSGYQSLDSHGEEADRGSVDRFADDGNDEDLEDDTDPRGEDDQSEQADRGSDEGRESTDGKDWKAEYERLQAEYDAVMGSFKASGRTVKVKSPDDARRLMQQGYDYSNKMRELKPRLRALKALEHNGLLDDEKFNFMIDLMAGKPEAVTKFLKDREIDPIELDLEDSAPYTPTDHRPSEEQLALDEVLESIRETETFPRVANVITKQWDKASQDVLMGQPRIIAVLNDHMAKGYYDQIVDQVDYERSLGRLAGLSDLDAYRTVGDALQAQGAFAPAGARTTPPPAASQGPSQDSKGSRDDIRNRKRAASPTKGGAGAGTGKSKNYLRDFSDEEIEKMGNKFL